MCRFGPPFVLHLERTVAWDLLQKEILEKMQCFLRPTVCIQVCVLVSPPRPVHARAGQGTATAGIRSSGLCVRRGRGRVPLGAGSECPVGPAGLRRSGPGVGPHFVAGAGSAGTPFSCSSNDV